MVPSKTSPFHHFPISPYKKLCENSTVYQGLMKGTVIFFLKKACLLCNLDIHLHLLLKRQYFILKKYHTSGYTKLQDKVAEEGDSGAQVVHRRC